MRLLLWLGLEKDQEKWTECCGGGEVAVFAETVSDRVSTQQQCSRVCLLFYMQFFSYIGVHVCCCVCTSATNICVLLQYCIFIVCSVLILARTGIEFVLTFHSIPV